MRKGVSPLIASVLLIAFTLSVAMVAGPFFSNTLKNTQNGSSDKANKVVSASQMNMEIKSVRYDSQTSNLTLTVQNSGNKEIENLSINVIGDKAYRKEPELKLKPKRIETIEIPVGNPWQLEEAKISLKNYPVSTSITNDGWANHKVTGKQVLNKYSYLENDVSAGSSSVTVDNSSKFYPADEIMIIQVQNGTGNGAAGQHAFRKVTSIDGNNLELNQSLSNSYYTGSFADTSENTGEVTQVIRIPRYNDLKVEGEVTTPQWNGRTGGIVAVRTSDKIEFNGGRINVTGKGFRGGLCGDCGDDWDGGRGEGITGWQYGGGTRHYTDSDAVSLNNWNGGGGNNVTDNDGGDPGAGGGHGTTGETVPDSQSSYDSEGGDTLGGSELSKVFFGGGGGSGADNDGGTPYPERSDGGGIIYIEAKTIQNAKIHAEGEDGKTDCGMSWAGNSGGGAGGAIHLTADSLNIDKVNATGGARSWDDCTEGSGEHGGKGGDGRIRLDYNSIAGKSNVEPLPGYEGTP